MFKRLFLALLVLCQCDIAETKQKIYGDIVVSKVLSVYDGDTFFCNLSDLHPIIGERIGIRVKGINTPEIKGGTEEERQKARECRDFVKKTILNTEAKIVLRNMSRDKYFRILADVYVDDVNLGQLLIDKGFARPYFGGKK